MLTQMCFLDGALVQYSTALSIRHWYCGHPAAVLEKENKLKINNF